MKTTPQTVAAAQPVEVGELTLIGVDSIDEDALRRVLRTRPSPSWPWSDPRYLDREALAADLLRIVAYYRDHGYPDAEVVSSNVAVDDAERKASITIEVREGEPILLEEVVLSAFDELAADERESLRDSMPLVAREPLIYTNVLAGAELAANALKDRGYPYAEVRVREEPAAANAVRVYFDAEPGPPGIFSDIEIVGNVSVGDEIIRRELAYRPGERFRRSLLQESQRQLNALGLFQFATIEIFDEATRQSEVRTRVTVAEAEHRRVDFSFGYGTEEKFRGELAWRNVNFLGDARTLALRTAWSSLNQGAQLDFVQPYFLHRRLQLAVDGHYWRAREPAYTLTARGGRAALLGRIDAATSWTLTLKGENQASRVMQAALDDPTLRDDLIGLGLNPVTGRQSGLLMSLAVGSQRSTVRNPLDPQQGFLLSVHVEQAGRWLPGAFNFFEWQLGGRYYLSLTDRAVLATRAQVATIDPSGRTPTLPFGRRYFLGGSTSLRGWGRYEVSPLSENGLPLGGNSMLDTSIEVRARMFGNFGIVAFADTGKVWRREWQFDLSDLLADVGAGIRYYTPVGPLRFDAAWQLTPIAGLMSEGQPQTRRWRVHFSIGQAF